MRGGGQYVEHKMETGFFLIVKWKKANFLAVKWKTGKPCKMENK